MDRNFLLAITLSFLVLFTWSLYTGKNRPSSIAQPAAEAIDVTEPETVARGDSPAVPTRTVTPGTSERGSAPAPAPVTADIGRDERVVVRTNLFNAELTTRGGALVGFELNDYRDMSRPDEPRVALTPNDGMLSLTTAFESLGYGDLSLAEFELEAADSSSVRFSREQDGIRIRKIYEFERDTYLFRVRLEIQNDSDRHVRPAFGIALPTQVGEDADFRELTLVAYTDGDLEQAPLAGAPSFLGMGGGSFEEVIHYPPGVDWAGAQTRYFLTAVVPDLPRDASARFVPLSIGESASVELSFTPVDLPPGQRVEKQYRVYLGPKESQRLDGAGAHLDEAILKGWFPSLTRFFIWALGAIHSIVPNYGWAIIIITIIVRSLMAPIMARQMKSMKRMGKLQPKLKEIQEKHKDDRTKQSEAMMALYRQEGVSPFSMMTGCLPMLLQLPVFIGFYYALQGAIDLRQQPFIGWINDLSAPETLFVIPGLDLPVRLLPLLMGASMVLQQKLSPTGAMDPAQARMMMTIMPVMFTFLFYQFASGLVLYWLVSNLLGILQQYVTNRQKD